MSTLKFDLNQFTFCQNINHIKNQVKSSFTGLLWMKKVYYKTT